MEEVNSYVRRGLRYNRAATIAGLLWVLLATAGSLTYVLVEALYLVGVL
jgi:hypothetical protein